MDEALLKSIQVGLPRQFGAMDAQDPMDRAWTTGFYKEPVKGPIHLHATNLAGDGQADLVHHGGPDKAVLAYSAEHYAYWRQTLNLPELPLGAFGENFSIVGLTEADVCIGDVWQIGQEVTVQVSQPRQPCWKLARRWRLKKLALQVQEIGYTGWYFRVLVEGVVGAGMPVRLVQRTHPTWSVQRANEVMHKERHDLASAAELAALPELASNWQATLSQRTEKPLSPDTSKRLVGPNEG